MEYERSEDGQIQAAFARRVGKVLLQYEAGARDIALEDQHEATLLICLLQAVLTQCIEAMRRKRGALRTALDAVLNVNLKDQPPRFGFDEGCIAVWGHTSSPPTYGDLIEVIRNALSHPTIQSEGGHPTTGYITVSDGTGLVQNFRFVASWWAKCAEKQRGFAETGRAQAMESARKLLAADQCSNLAWCKRSGSYFLELEGQPFVPHTIVTLSVLQLRTLTLELSDLLGADSGSQAVGMKGHEAKPTNALSESAIVHGAPHGRS